MTETEPDEFITDGKSFYTFFRSPLVTGYMPVPIPKGDPVLRWHGPKIDLESQWRPALKFMRDYCDHEVILRLWMTPERDQIIIFPLTQTWGTGMSVKEEITPQERNEWAAAGLVEAGTMHSHCDATAFQSGTDRDDEQARDGLHVTIGKLKNKEQLDLHARMTWTVPGEERDGQVVRASLRTIQAPNLLDWFLLPDHVAQFIFQEPELEQSVVKYILTKPPDKRVSYPESWKEKLIKKVEMTQMHPGYHPGFGHYHQEELSVSADVPFPQDSKKKDESQNVPSAGETRIWDLWSEIMGIIADNPHLRAAKVSVSEFEPTKRPFLFKVVPPAIDTWAEIQQLLVANHVSEDEFFRYLG